MTTSRLVVGIVLMLVGALCVSDGWSQNNNRRQMRASHGRQSQNMVRNRNGQANMNPAANGVQMLLSRFDRNRNGALEGEELAAVAAAFQQMMMAMRGGQAMGQPGMMQGMGHGGMMQGQGMGGAGMMHRHGGMMQGQQGMGGAGMMRWGPANRRQGAAGHQHGFGQGGRH